MGGKAREVDRGQVLEWSVLNTEFEGCFPVCLFVFIICPTIRKLCF